MDGRDDEGMLPAVAEAAPPAPPRFKIAISGMPCSGKTTLATLLEHILSGYAHPSPSDHQDGRPPVPVISQQLYCRPPTALLPAPNRDNEGGYIEEPNRDILEACDWAQLEKHFNALKADKPVGTPRAEYPSDITDVAAAKQAALESPFLASIVQDARYYINNAISLCCPPSQLPAGGFPGRYFRRPDVNGAGGLAVRFGIIEGGLLFTDNILDDLEGATDKAIQQRIRDACDLRLFLHVKRDLSRERFFARPANQDPPIGTRDPADWWRSKRYYEAVALPNNGAHSEPIMKLLPHREKWRGGKVMGIDVKGTKEGHKDVRGTVLWAVELIMAELTKRELWEWDNWHQGVQGHVQQGPRGSRR